MPVRFDQSVSKSRNTYEIISMMLMEYFFMTLTILQVCDKI